ncbi:hypothetical protein RRG08_013963 [Elysia crispata]|uniref:Uncharacterized protein n=1 Tax=Elysia crispata TaxID=231223 RepID=A0AAE0YT19_9GAST|nr:hypothetical protein RRG08_013963 [Elysia crispata]
MSSNLPSISHTVFSVLIFPVSHTLSSQFQSSQYLTHCLLSSNLPSISHTVFSVPNPMSSIAISGELLTNKLWCIVTFFITRRRVYGERGQSSRVRLFVVKNYSERDRRDLKTTLTSCHVSDETHCSSETGVLYFLDDLGVIMYDSFRDTSRHNSIHVRLTSCSNDALVR